MGILLDKKKKKVESLFNAAFDLFISKGIENTSISDITEKANVAKGTFYLYFKNKYDLSDKLISFKSKDIIRQAINTLSINDKENLNEKIIFITDYVINIFIKQPELLNFISKNLNWGILHRALEKDEEKNSIRQEFFNMIEEDESEFKEPEIMIYMILELINGICHNVILYKEPTDIETIKPFLYKDINAMIENHKIK